MLVLRGKLVASRAAIMAATLALGMGLTAPVFAEDAPAPTDQAKPPVLVPDSPAAAGTSSPPSAASFEQNPCFTGKGSIKDVLDA